VHYYHYPTLLLGRHSLKVLHGHGCWRLLLLLLGHDVLLRLGRGWLLRGPVEEGSVAGGGRATAAILLNDQCGGALLRGHVIPSGRELETRQ